MDKQQSFNHSVVDLQNKYFDKHLRTGLDNIIQHTSTLLILLSTTIDKI